MLLLLLCELEVLFLVFDSIDILLVVALSVHGPLITICVQVRLLVIHIINDELRSVLVAHVTSIGILVELLGQLLGEASITLLNKHLA